MSTNYAAPEGSSVAPATTGARKGGSGAGDTGGRWVRLLRIGFVAALLLQVYLLYGFTPGPSSAVPIPHLDKVAHIGMFALPAFLGVLARVRPWVVGLLLVAHAPVSEVIQHRFLAARAGDPWDLVADVVGIGLGLALGLLLRPTGGRAARDG